MGAGLRCVAIANRGEAAARFVRAVREMRARGEDPPRALALYTPADRHSPYVRDADLRVPLPGDRPARSVHLDAALLIDAARRGGADAVWPGWGFLAEDAAFAQAVADAGLRFVGPSPETLRRVADKILAKQLAEELEIPVPPWSGGPLRDASHAARRARALGYPLFIKSALSGGGRGIRVVGSAAELDAAFTSAAAEARAAHGSERMFLERGIEDARHVEVQLAADRRGRVRVAGTRECSVQRRCQKLVEEAPAALAPELRARLEEWATRFAAAVRYEGVGTVEFLVRDDEAWLLEMNPRLQVEHGITEETARIDLVALQLRIARGEELADPFPAERGFAIEARLCAEDPDRDGAPAPGRVSRFQAPLGRGVRVDSGVSVGSEVSSEFDSLLAKVIARGETREQARRRLVMALCECELVLAGGATNRARLIEILESEDFRNGAIDTGWHERWESRRRAAGGDAAHALIAAAVLHARSRRRALLERFTAEGPASRPPAPEGLLVELVEGGRSLRPRVLEIAPGRYAVSLDDRTAEVSLCDDGPGAAQLEIGGRSLRILHDVTAARTRIEIAGCVFAFGTCAAGEVRAAGPAVVSGLFVRAGDRVERGDCVAALETMKIETSVSAPITGVVRSVSVCVGQQVATGALLATVEPEASGDPRAAPALRLPDTTTAPEVADAAWTLLGYELDDARERRLMAVIADAEQDPSPRARQARLAQLARAVEIVADVESLFDASPREGDVPGPSNAFLLESHLSRLDSRRPAPDALAPLLRRLTAHDGESGDRDASHALLHRLWESRRHQPARRRLAVALLAALARCTPVPDPLARGLSNALERISQTAAADLADAAIETRSALFLLPGLDARGDPPAARGVERAARGGVLSQGELGAVAGARPELFAVAGAGLGDPDARRSTLSLSVHVRRLYAPRTPHFHTWILRDDVWSDRFDFPEGLTVFASSCEPRDAVSRALQLQGVASSAARSEAFFELEAIEILVTVPPGRDAEALARAVCRECESAPFDGSALGAARLTFSFVCAGTPRLHRTYVAHARGGLTLLPLDGLHPQLARRLDLSCLGRYELERITDDPTLFAFRARARDDDETLLVAMVEAHLPEAEDDATPRAALERRLRDALLALRRALRGATSIAASRVHLSVCAPARREPDRIAQWIAEVVAPEVHSLRLAEVALRVHAPDGTVVPPVARKAELRVESGHGLRCRVAWTPGEPVVRAPARSETRCATHPRDVLRLLTGTPPVDDELPVAAFEEFDLDPDTGEPVRTAARSPGRHECGVLFGLLTTPTEEVPEGLRRVLLLSDPTRSMGSLGAAECARIVAAIDLAETRRIPVEWVAVSSGARISMDSGTENLDATARVARRIVRFADAGGVIHVVVDGVNAGAQSYFDALATMLMDARGALVLTTRGSLVLTGRTALGASGCVAGDDELAIGGFERIMGPNGEAQYGARDLVAAFRLLHAHYRYTYVVPGERLPRRRPTRDPDDRDLTREPYPPSEAEPFHTLGDLFDDRVNPERKLPFDMRALMRGLVDRDARPLERWASLAGGETAIVWDAQIGGHPVCLIGIEGRNRPRAGGSAHDGPATWTAGTLFPMSSKKVARALNAASGMRPVVVLANLVGFDGSPESLRNLQLEYGAEIVRAVVRFQGPLLFHVVSRYHGGAYVVFSRELNPQLRASALEGSYASVIGGAAAAAAVFPRQIRDATRSDPRVRALLEEIGEHPTPDDRARLAELERLVRFEKQAEIAARFDAVHTVERAREVGSLEDIIPPRALRPYVVGQLREVWLRAGLPAAPEVECAS